MYVMAPGKYTNYLFSPENYGTKATGIHSRKYWETCAISKRTRGTEKT